MPVGVGEEHVMARCAQNDNNNGGMRLRRKGEHESGARKRSARDEFPSLWESMEDDVSDHFEDLWRRI
jgi:hypothetical protein